MHNEAEKYAVLKFSCILSHFYFVLKKYITNFSKLSSFRLIRVSDSTFLNIEDDPSTSQEVTGAYLNEKNWAKVSLY